MRVKKIFFSFLLSLVSICSGSSVYASHVYGGDLLYKHVSGDLYRVTLTLYGDCSSGVFPSLLQSTAKIYIYKNGSFYSFRDLLREDDGVEVSPVCPRMLPNTTCNGGSLPGVKRFIFSDTVTLVGLAANWRFIFSGDLGISQAGRSQNITNAAASTMQIEARLNNLTAPNSSPQYTSIPTPFYCLRPGQQYNQGAIDADGDSLVFSLVSGVNGGNTQSPLLSVPVDYFAPYSGETPIGTAAGDFSFNELNGQMTFTPSTIQNALVVSQVSEYRNGVLIGTSQREMTFIVSADCDGNPPTLKVTNTVGGVVTGKNVINICIGTPRVAFGIAVANPDRDTTYITPRSVPENAVLTVNQNSTPDPSIAFSWETAGLPAGVYTFFLDVRNNHCPIANRQTIAYTINITPFPTVAASPVLPTNCVRQALVEYKLALGYVPRSVVVSNGAGILYNYTDTTGLIRDSLPVGNYTVVASCSPLCTVTETFAIVDSGKLPLQPIRQVFCQRDRVAQLQIDKEGPDAVVTWYDANNNILPDAPTPTTSLPATFRWYVSERYKVCTSDKAPVDVIVNPLPVPQIINDPQNICFGDTVYLEATGGVQYSWTPEDRIQTGTNGKLFTRLTNPGLFWAKAVNEFGCMDSVSVKYDNIQPCCQFSYPSAFTPNGDGHNDGFKIITYGNTRSYKLAVYNRWGQMVFLTYDPGQYWDGKQYGVPCETGTYYYFFSGKCLTSANEENREGDLTLIR
jgi:gliding motility-associated-like protein